MSQKEMTYLFDFEIDAPEGANPSKIRLLFDKKTRVYSEQYHDALKIARGIPMQISTIPVTDPLVLIMANVYRIKDGDKARLLAMQQYERWSYEALKHAWMMAILSTNTFTEPPKEWEEDEPPPPGIPVIPEPKFDISNPTEYRLKQIVDYLNVSQDFQLAVMSRVNDSMVALVNEADETDERTGFQPNSTNPVVHTQAESDNDNDSAKPNRRKTNKA